MGFSFFTKRTAKPSLRLRVLAAGFHVFGAIGTVAIAFAFWRANFSGLAHEISKSTATRMVVPFVIQTLSLFIIGRALRKRQRWGAYLAGVTVGLPLVQQLMTPYAPLMSIKEIAATTVALCMMVTVWDELQTIRDSDFEVTENEENETNADDAVKTASGPELLSSPVPTFEAPVRDIESVHQTA